MLPFDFNNIIARDTKRKQEKRGERKEIPLREYLELVKGDLLIPQSSASRILEIIEDAGVGIIPEEDRWFGLDVDKEYMLFNDLYGISKTIYEIVNYFKMGRNKGSTAKQMLILVGPPATGKSSLVRKLMRQLEKYRKRPVYVIKGCPKWEEPLHLLPRYLRDEVAMRPEECLECQKNCEEKHLHLGIKIEGDLCPVCQDMLKTKFTRDDETVEWWNVPVQTFTFSIQARRGIGSFEPSDEKSSDMTVLSGRENIAITATKGGYNDPRAYELSGEIPKAERGICEGREILSCDPEVLQIFFSIGEEKELKVTGSNFPQLSVDTVVIGHTNLTVYKEFSANKKFEGLHQRFYKVFVPYPLRVKDEVKIYRKLIERESDFVRLKKCHIAPGTLELAATFSVLTRLLPSNLGLDLLTKLKVYNGDKVLTEIEAKEKKPIDIRQLLQEGQSKDDDAKREGMFGVSSRDVLAALNSALVEQAEHNGCLTPLKALKALRDVFAHRMGYTPEEVQKYKAFLSVGESASVMIEYKDFVLKVVTKAFLRAYNDLAKEIFQKYMEEVAYASSLKRKYIQGQFLNLKRDEITGKPKEPDLKFLRSVEQYIPISEDQADTFRGEILAAKGIKSDFSFETYEPLARAVEKKLLADTKSSLTLVIASDKPKGEEEKKRLNDLLGGLKEMEYCDLCAKEMMEKAREFLSE